MIKGGVWVSPSTGSSITQAVSPQDQINDGDYMGMLLTISMFLAKMNFLLIISFDLTLYLMTNNNYTWKGVVKFACITKLYSCVIFFLGYSVTSGHFSSPSNTGLINYN